MFELRIVSVRSSQSLQRKEWLASEEYGHAAKYNRIQRNMVMQRNTIAKLLEV